MSINTIKLSLPWPISVNKMYAHNKNGRRFLTRAAREYKENGCWLIVEQLQKQNIPPRFQFKTPVEILCEWEPPMRRGPVGDEDNYNKIVRDTLEKSGLLQNDRLIKKSTSIFKEKKGEGKVDIFLKEIDNN